MTSLLQQQTLFHRLVTAPENVATTLKGEFTELESTIQGDTKLSATERLDIYANMYFFRILEVMQTQFKRVYECVGDEQFHNLITDYLMAHPPSHFSLSYVGQHFATFLKKHSLALEHPHLSDMALLEWHHVHLFEAKDEQVLTFADIQQLTPEALSDLPLKLIENHRLIISEYAIIETKKIPTKLLVWRNHLSVEYRPLETIEYQALLFAQKTPTFSELCDYLCELLPEEEVTAQAFDLLSRWLRERILVKT